MDEAIYLAMTGAKQTEYAQAINSNNLANISTTGFRADLHAFQSVAVEGPGLESRVNAVVDGHRTDFSSGAIAHTGRNLDVALQTDGFIAVESPNGGEAYSRAGDLRLSSGGILVNGAGHRIIGDGGPVAIPPFEQLLIGADGTISVQPLGQGPETLAVVDRIKLVNPDVRQLTKGDDGLLRHVDGRVAESDAGVRLTSGALEQSNVNSAQTLVNMIELSRQYELQIKTIRTAKENADAAAKLLSVT